MWQKLTIGLLREFEVLQSILKTFNLHDCLFLYVNRNKLEWEREQNTFKSYRTHFIVVLSIIMKHIVKKFVNICWYDIYEFLYTCLGLGFSIMHTCSHININVQSKRRENDAEIWKPFNKCHLLFCVSGCWWNIQTKKIWLKFLK